MFGKDLALDFAQAEKSTIGRSQKIDLPIETIGLGGEPQDMEVDPLAQIIETGERHRPMAPSALRWALRFLSSVAPGVAVSLAERIFLRPPRFKAPRRELWWETEAEAFKLPLRLSSGPKELAAWRWGSGGPTVVLIHGWGGRGLQLAAFAEPLVEAGFQVLAVDLPAHGRSPGVSTSLPEAAEAVSAVLEYAASGSEGVAALVAHSFGCAASAVALAQGAKLPQRVIFIAPPGDLDSVTERFAELTGFSMEVMLRMRERLSKRFGFDWPSLHPWRLTANIRCPFLVIHDSDDAETPWTAGRLLADGAPEGRLHRTTGLGHFRILRDTTVTAKAAAFIGDTALDRRSVA